MFGFQASHWGVGPILFASEPKGTAGGGGAQRAGLPGGSERMPTRNPP